MDQLLCARCKEKPKAAGRKSCEDCLSYGRKYALNNASVCKEKNLCVECHSIKTREGVYCQSCLDKQRLDRQEWKKDGLCIICGRELVEKGKARCSSCIERAKRQDNKTRRERKKNGQCTKCGCFVIAPHTKCDKCRNNKTAMYASLVEKRKKDGLCINCGSTPLDGNRFCEICYLKKIATKGAGGASNWQKLKMLFESQNRICPYTGRILTMGKDAGLDHIVPKALGGTDDVENLQWVYKIVNTLKWNQLERDFLAVIKEIYTYRKM
jgi:hypothetical protein